MATWLIAIQRAMIQKVSTIVILKPQLRASFF